jgi:hypothetical protein
MSLTNYSDLQTTIASYLARSDLTAMIPDFIRLAETRLRRELRIRQMLKVVTTTTTAGDSTVELPSDFLQMRDMHLGTNPAATLEYQSPSALFRNSRTTESGLPRQYTVLAQEFQLSPVPDSAYTVNLLYYSAPVFMSSSVASNAFMAICPDLLLYASLGEAEPYLMNDGRLQVWATLYDRGLNALTVSDDQGEYAGSPISISIATR